MAANVVKNTGKMVTIQVEIPLGGTMLQNEDLIQEAVNDVGRLATAEAVKCFDADGSPIIVGSVKFTSKGQHGEYYQTPYGEIHVERHVYQSSRGGKTFCPLENNSRMVLNSTPRFAKVISSKYACFGANDVCRDLLDNHGRKISRGYVKNVSDMVASVAIAKEENWEYDLPQMPNAVASVSLGADGTCMLQCEDGWREAMAGTMSFYDSNGERMHTIYIGTAPEYGKEQFTAKFTREVERIKAKYPDAFYVGLADGASWNWELLAPYTDRDTVDFYHASEYLSGAAFAIFGHRRKQKTEWLEERLSRLKHKQGGANRILRELKSYEDSVPTRKERKQKLMKAIKYFENRLDKMQYYRNVRDNLPIGSGVTEAACKVLVKQRLCRSGSRWKNKGAACVISLRALHLTPGRWEQFWKKYDQYGMAA